MWHRKYETDAAASPLPTEKSQQHEDPRVSLEVGKRYNALEACTKRVDAVDRPSKGLCLFLGARAIGIADTCARASNASLLASIRWDPRASPIAST